MGCYTQKFLTMYTTLLTNNEHGIFTITINRPEKLNALNGQVIETFTTSSTSSSRDLSYLNEGMYLITVATANGNTTKRIVIKK